MSVKRGKFRTRIVSERVHLSNSRIRMCTTIYIRVLPPGYGPKTKGHFNVIQELRT